MLFKGIMRQMDTSVETWFKFTKKGDMRNESEGGKKKEEPTYSILQGGNLC